MASTITPSSALSPSPLPSPLPNMVTLKSSDGVEFEVETKVALQSHVIKSFIQLQVNNIGPKNFQLPNVTAATLTHVIEYCKKHADADAPTIDNEQLKQWDQEFIRGFDVPNLFKIFHAANDMLIKSLLDLSAERVSKLM